MPTDAANAGEKQQIGRCAHCGKVGTLVHRHEWMPGEPEWFCRLSDGGCGKEQHFQAASRAEIESELANPSPRAAGPGTGET